MENNQTNQHSKQLVLASGITPVGLAVYPYLSAPDVKYNADGVFKTTLRLTAEEAASLIEQIDNAQEESVSIAKQTPPEHCQCAQSMKRLPQR